MWLRIAAGGHRVGYLPEATMTYLWHGKNLSADACAVSATALLTLTRLFAAGTLPRSLERVTLSRWALVHAGNCLAADDGKGACTALVEAARQRPASVRPGWVLLLVRSLWSMFTSRTKG